MRADCSSHDQPALGVLSFTTLHRVIDLALKYPLVRLSAASAHVVTEWSDNEGPFPERFRAIESAAGSDADWRVELHYESTAEDEYQFEALVTRDYATAYKPGRKTPPIRTRFRLRMARFWPRAGELLAKDAGSRVISNVVRLDRFYAELERQVSTLHGWADGGFDMFVRCRSCLNEGRIANEDVRLHAKNVHAVNDLAAKLKCSRCGQTNAYFAPATHNALY